VARRITSIALGSTLAASVALFGVLNRDDGEDCRATNHELAAAWNDEVQGEVKLAFQRTGLAIAADVFARVEDSVDGFRASWQQSYDTWCDATVAGEHLSAKSQGEMQRQCLRRTANDLGNLSAIFRRADTKVIERALTALEALPQPSECLTNPESIIADDSSLTAAQRQKAKELETELAAIRALALTDKFKEVASGIESIRAQVDALGWLPLMTDLRIIEATWARNRWWHVQAYELATQALLSSEAQNDRVRMLQAARIRDYAASYAYPGDILEIVQSASANSVRAHEDDLLRARTFDHNSTILGNAERHELAEFYGIQSLALIEKSPPSHERDNHRAHIAAALGGTYLQLGRVADALPLLESSLRNMEMIYGSAHPVIIAPLWNLALANNMQRNFGGSLTYSGRGLRIVEALDGGWEPRAAPLLHYRLDSLRALLRYGRAAQEYPRVNPLYVKMFSANHFRTIGMWADELAALIDAGELDEISGRLNDLNDVVARSQYESFVRPRMLELNLRWAIAQRREPEMRVLLASNTLAEASNHPLLQITAARARLLAAELRGDRHDHRQLARDISELFRENVSDFSAADDAIQALRSHAEGEIAARILEVAMHETALNREGLDPRKIWIAIWRGQLAEDRHDPIEVASALKAADELLHANAEEITNQQRQNWIDLGVKLRAKLPHEIKKAPP
jgi:hypothetical protein